MPPASLSSRGLSHSRRLAFMSAVRRPAGRRSACRSASLTCAQSKFCSVSNMFQERAFRHSCGWPPNYELLSLVPDDGAAVDLAEVHACEDLVRHLRRELHISACCARLRSRLHCSVIVNAKFANSWVWCACNFTMLPERFGRCGALRLSWICVGRFANQVAAAASISILEVVPPHPPRMLCCGCHPRCCCAMCCCC